MTDPWVTLQSPPRFYLEQREAQTHLGCKVKTAFTALGQDKSGFFGVIEHVVLNVEER